MNGLQKSIILKALDNLEDLSEWEVDFVQGLADKHEDYPISEKQNKIINRIWEKIE